MYLNFKILAFIILQEVEVFSLNNFGEKHVCPVSKLFILFNKLENELEIDIKKI